jgi:hypothetical protein
MKKIIILTIFFIFLATLAGYGNSSSSDINMANAEATMQSYYEALNSNEYDDFKRLHTDDGYVLSEIEFNELSERFRDYTIIQNTEMVGGVSDSTRRFIQVKEIYGGSYGPSLMNYVLLKKSQLWKIESYNADEGTPENDEVVIKQVEDMFK